MAIDEASKGGGILDSEYARFFGPCFIGHFVIRSFP